MCFPVTHADTQTAAQLPIFQTIHLGLPRMTLFNITETDRIILFHLHKNQFHIFKTELSKQLNTNCKTQPCEQQQISAFSRLLLKEVTFIFNQHAC